MQYILRKLSVKSERGGNKTVTNSRRVIHRTRTTTLDPRGAGYFPGFLPEKRPEEIVAGGARTRAFVSLVFFLFPSAAYVSFAPSCTLFPLRVYFQESRAETAFELLHPVQGHLRRGSWHAFRSVPRDFCIIADCGKKGSGWILQVVGVGEFINNSLLYSHKFLAWVSVLEHLQARQFV